MSKQIFGIKPTKFGKATGIKASSVFLSRRAATTQLKSMKNVFGGSKGTFGKVIVKGRVSGPKYRSLFKGARKIT